MSQSNFKPIGFAKNSRLSFNIRHLVETQPKVTVKQLHRMGVTDEEIIEAYKSKGGIVPCMYFRNPEGEGSCCWFEQNGLSLPHHEFSDNENSIWFCDFHFWKLVPHLEAYDPTKTRLHKKMDF